MKCIKTITLIISAMLASSSCMSDSPKKQMIEKLSSLQENSQYMFGHQDSYFYGHSWENITGNNEVSPEKSDIYTTCGDFPAVMGCDLGGLELGKDKNLDGVPFEAIRQSIILQHRMGGVSTISWHMNNPVTGSNAWDVTCDTVVRAILPGHSYNEKFEEWLEKVTDFISSLKDDTGNQIPVIFRPYHENTGSWFWWGQKLCSDEEYLELWQYTHDFFTKKGIKDILWAYSPGGGQKGYMDRYPGDRYTDILGLDAYHHGGIITSDLFINSTNKELAAISKIAAEHHKLTALTETGAESLPDPEWWTNVLTETMKGTSACYVLVWRNAFDRPDHFFAPFPGQKSADDFLNFHDLKETIFVKDLNR